MVSHFVVPTSCKKHSVELAHNAGKDLNIQEAWPEARRPAGLKLSGGTMFDMTLWDVRIGRIFRHGDTYSLS